MTNREPKLIRWKGAEIRECDLPEGVRYRLLNVALAYIATTGGRTVRVWDGESEEFRLIERSRCDEPVHILDWPDHCGPRPDANPTWKQIVDGAPSPEAKLVFVKDGVEDIRSEVRYLRGTNGVPYDCFGTFLGYLVWEPTE